MAKPGNATGRGCRSESPYQWLCRIWNCQQPGNVGKWSLLCFDPATTVRQYSAVQKMKQLCMHEVASRQNAGHCGSGLLIVSCLFNERMVGCDSGPAEQAQKRGHNISPTYPQVGSPTTYLSYHGVLTLEVLSIRKSACQCGYFAWLLCIAVLADCHDVMLINCTMKNVSVNAKNTIGLHLEFSSWKACKVKNSHFVHSAN